MSYPEDGITFHTETLTADDLTFDIGFGDVIVPRPQELEYPTLMVLL